MNEAAGDEKSVCLLSMRLRVSLLARSASRLRRSVCTALKTSAKTVISIGYFSSVGIHLTGALQSVGTPEVEDTV